VSGSVSGLVPFVHVADVERSVAFYRLLGLEVNDTFAPRGHVVWAWLENDGASTSSPTGWRPATATA